MPQAKEIRVTFHGWEHAQYFQGHGVSFTRFTDCVTGIGESTSAALDDALEQIASAGAWEVSDEQIREAVFEECGKTLEGLEEESENDSSAMHDGCPTDEREHEGCELSYFVSIDLR